MNLLEGLIPTKETGGLAGDHHLERLFVFCLMWSLGALLELQDREKLENFIQAHDSHIDVPQTQQGETMFEYMVNTNGTALKTTTLLPLTVFLKCLKHCYCLHL